MKKFTKLLAVLLVLCMVFAMIPMASAEETSNLPVVEEGTKVILHTNDVHTYIDGDIRYSHVAALKEYYEGLGAEVILVDAGDHIQGTAYGSMDKGETIVDLMNAAGYDVATLGNHEFDYGMEGRINVTDEWAEYPYVSCNFYHEVDGVAGDSVLAPYVVFEMGDEKVAVVGVTTPETFTKSTPAYFQDASGNYIYGIAGGNDGAALYAAVQAAVDAAKLEADTVVVLGHLGVDAASQPWTSEEVIANTNGFDIFIDGHSHSDVPGKAVANKDGENVWIAQTGEYLNAIGVTIIGETSQTFLLSAADVASLGIEADAEVAAIEDAWITAIDEQLGEVIGYAEVTFDNYDANGNRLVRKQETNTGDFAADALYYLFDNMDLDVDVAIMNGGGVRNKAITGELSYKTMKDIHTFGNVACLQTITGQQLLDALEWGARGTPIEEIGGLLHVSGISYEINTYIPSTVQADEKGVWVGGPTGEYRVKNVMFFNEETGEYDIPLDVEAEYNLAGYNYTLRDLGDGFAMFDGAVNVLDYVMEDYMVLANYVKSFPKAIREISGEEKEVPVITADNSPYGDVYGAGRITIVSNDPTEFATDDEIVIYYTNDVHTYIDKELGYDDIAYLKDQTAYDAAGVLLVDAGDHIQGTAYGSMDKGENIIALMNAAGYDLATLGNHEFDYGMDGRIKVTDEWAKFPYVSANFYYEENGVVGETVLDAYKVFEVAGVKIALIGVTTPETFTKSTPAYFQDANGNYIYGIAGGEDGKALYAAVQKAIDAASAEADIVIALAHLGDDPASQPRTSEELIANTTGLDALIDGHSHSTVPMKEVKDQAGNVVVLTQTGEYFGAIGRMSINVETQAIATELVKETGGYDADVKKIQDAWITAIDEQLGEVIGYADVVFDNYDETGRLVRKQETNTGDFAADALYYLFDNMGLDVDVAIMNGGGVRNKTITGELSYKTMKDIHTFGNVACLQTITGQQLLDALEWGARGTYGEEIGGFLHVSGITYDIHTYIESTVQADEKGVWIGGPTGEYRVKNVKIMQDGKWVDLDLKAKYNLAGYNYTLRDLGDGFAMFDGAVNVLDYVMEDYMVLANYVKSFPVEGGFEYPTITAKNSPYGSIYGEGRISLIARDFKDVARNAYYFDAVQWAALNGVTSGTSAATFSPAKTATRAEIVAMLWRQAGSPEPTITENPFKDVKEGAYYYKAVLWAVENKITAGVSATAFAPDKVCTRAEAVAFMYRSQENPDSDYPMNPFLDVKFEDYYYEAVIWAYKAGITVGVAQNTFAPDATCSRAEIVTFLYRAAH